MKNLLFLIFIICALKANAQNFLVSFAGTGASATVSTVKVENLTSGTTLSLNGSDVLRLTVTTGVNSIDDGQSSKTKIYPNPMTGNSVLQISPPVAGDATISVYDMTGKLVAQTQSYLENSLQEFRFSGINYGFYLISVKGNSYQHTERLLCNSNSGGTISIEKISSNKTGVEKTLKTNPKGTQSTVDMEYTIGDRLKLTGSSGIYSTVMTDIPTSDKTITFNFIACTDGDNNNYSIVEIGTQVWMAENLKTTRFKTNISIPNETDDVTWPTLTTPAFCWYNNDASTYKTPYGALYNWYAVNTGNLCPLGWHVPSEPEFIALDAYLESDNSGGKVKETGTSHWFSPNTGATNETGFTAVPGGERYSDFRLLGYWGFWWVSTEYSATHAEVGLLYYDDGIMDGDWYKKECGFSVRCKKD